MHKKETYKMETTSASTQGNYYWTFTANCRQINANKQMGEWSHKKCKSSDTKLKKNIMIFCFKKAWQKYANKYFILIHLFGFIDLIHMKCN